VYTLDASGDANASDFCERHRLDPSESRPKVYDAIIFSVELDLLEIRIHELYDVVDTFIIVESNVTFSGEPKPLVFQENMERFHFAQDKIAYQAVTDLHVYSQESEGSLRKEVAQTKENPMDNEIRMRQGVGDVIRSLQPEVGSLILQSDVDEMPSTLAVQLLRQCSGWGDAIHLGMPTYLYSFEFPMQRTEADNGVGQGHGPRQSRASVKRYRPNQTSYTHSRITDTILERAGWHCTFCFRYLEDFVFKMTWVKFDNIPRLNSEDI
jgi:beta-1,4-mannosyl-glycoprotein beta-1,4-N-acetylglucosaminyltransferase